MADSPERIAAGLRYLQEQTPANPLAGVSMAGLRDAYERRVQPVINNFRQEFETGSVLGDLLRAYAGPAALANAAVVKGMGMPTSAPMTAPRVEGVTSGENFRPMGDARQQFVGRTLGDPTNLLPMVGPAARVAVAAGKAAGKAAAPRIARGLEQHMVNTGGMLPMDVWHGSPHRFSPTAKNPLGELDASKIGTGEGAQAYGHGLYLAEAKGTAKYYADNLAKIEEGMTLQVTNPTRGKGIANDFHKFVHETYLDAAANIEKGAKLDPIAFKNDVFTLFDDFGKYPLTSEQKENLWKQMIANGAIKKANKVSSNIYKVDLPDEQIAKMLDWDKPLSQQAPGVRKAFLSTRKNLTPMDIENLGGRAAVNQLYGMDNTVDNFLGAWQSLRGSKDAGEKMLRDAGITGIRYLDGGSRGAGAGTSNFVVFDPAHMNILERNGVTAASLRNVAPQDEALRLAQQRAALPVEQHGLGLPAGNTPQQRADAMGFDIDAYKGMYPYDVRSSPSFGFKNGKFQQLDKFGEELLPVTEIVPELMSKMELGGKHAGFYGGKDVANRFAGYGTNSAVFPVKLNMGQNPLVKDASGQYAGRYQFERPARDAGMLDDYRDFHGAFFMDSPSTGAILKNTTDEGTIFVPKSGEQVRSRFAAFDPWRRNKALAAALGVAAPDLLAKEK